MNNYFLLLGITIPLVGCFGSDNDRITTSESDSNNTSSSESNNDPNAVTAFDIDLESAWVQAYPDTQGKPTANLTDCPIDKIFEAAEELKDYLEFTSTETKFDIVLEINNAVNRIQCGTISVPQDWTKPADEKFTIDFYYHPVANAKGTIFYNPGGPGAAPSLSSVLLPSELYSRYGDGKTFDNAFNTVNQFSYVGIINRGVVENRGDENPLCSSNQIVNAEQLRNLTRDQVDLLKTLADQQWEGCRENKVLLQTMGTDQVINDYDSIREALNIDRIDYLGVSYGTVIGQLYAAKFPNNLRTLTLDSNVSLSAESGLYNDGLELRINTIKAFFKECDIPILGCPFYQIDGTSSFDRFENLLADTKNKDLKYSYLNPETGTTEEAVFENIGLRAFSSIATPLLHDAGKKYELWMALDELERKYETGEQLTFPIWSILDNDASKGQLDVSFKTISTMDTLFYNDPGDIITAHNNLSVSDTFKDALFYAEKFNLRIPYLNPWRSRPLNRITSDVPALIVSNEYDLATPVEWSREVASAFPQSRFLLSGYGLGHGVIGSNDCINGYALSYLDTEQLPSEDVVCKLSPGQVFIFDVY